MWKNNLEPSNSKLIFAVCLFIQQAFGEYLPGANARQRIVVKKQEWDQKSKYTLTKLPNQNFSIFF